MYWLIFLDFDPRSETAVTLITKNLLVCMIKWEPVIQSLQNLVAISLSHAYHMIIVRRHSVGNFFLYIYKKKKIWMYVFKVKHSIGHISRKVGPIDMQQKGSASVGYWMNYVTLTLTFDLTHDLNLGFFKVKFFNSSISGIVGLINEKEANQLDTGPNIWSCPLTIPMTMTLKFQGQILK